MALFVVLAASLVAVPPATSEPTISDLGTLSGDSTSVAYRINEAGRAVGTSGGFPLHAVLFEEGVVTDLGTLGEGGIASAYGINDADQIVGHSNTPSGTHAFLWEDGAMTDLGTLPEGDYSYSRAVNNARQVVGWSDTFHFGFSHAFLWEDGTMTDLGSLSGGEYGYSQAFDVNDTGAVVGSSDTASGSVHAFLWEDGTMTDLGTLPGGQHSVALGINDRGQVVGRSSLASLSHHAFLWQNGTMTDLGTLGGSQSEASAINNAGQIVGVSNDSSGAEHAFLWENGTITDLGTLPNGGYSFAYAINEAGQIVGESGGHAVLWSGATEVRDIAVISASASPLLADVGTLITISATVANKGTQLAAGTVIASAGPIVIGTKVVADLGPGDSDSVSFDWDTSIVDPGSYQLKVDAVAPWGDEDLTNNEFFVGEVLLSAAMKARIIAVPGETDVSQSISFRCRATGGTTPYGFSWDFGDGTLASGELGTHSYKSPGRKTVSCAVTDASGSLVTSRLTVLVHPAPKVRATANPSFSLIGMPLKFTAEVRGGTRPFTYEWAFGDGGTASGPTSSHVYLSPGRYAAVVRVVDAVGGRASSEVIVTVAGFSLDVHRAALALSVDVGLSNPIVTGGSSESSVAFSHLPGVLVYRVAPDLLLPLVFSTTASSPGGLSRSRSSLAHRPFGGVDSQALPLESCSPTTKLAGRLARSALTTPEGFWTGTDGEKEVNGQTALSVRGSPFSDMVTGR